MKIKAKVKNVPGGVKNWGKYGELWVSVQTLSKGEFLPIEFETKREATNLYLAAITHRSLHIKANMRGLTVYLSYKGVRRNGDNGAGRGDANDTEDSQASDPK